MEETAIMRRVLRLARKGLGRVSPNPLVGAVIVKNKQIVSEGHHDSLGGPHAEIAAMSRAKPSDLHESDLYVNLEPCNHYGKTPPCADAIIQAGIKRVVIGMTDPNPLVKGKGIQKMRKAGIIVETGLLEKECIRLNEAFIKFITENKPFVTLKSAQTLDGKIATSNGLSKWITSDESRRWVHRLRSEQDAVLVGIGTVLADDPKLTIRLVRRRGGKRIVLDSRLRIPLKSKILHLPDPGNTIVVTTEDEKHPKREQLDSMGVTTWQVSEVENGSITLKPLLKKMAESSMQSVLVEGGSRIFSSFLNAGEADRLVVFTAPKLFGRGIDPFAGMDVRNPQNAIVFRSVAWQKIGEDMMFDGRL